LGDFDFDLFFRPSCFASSLLNDLDGLGECDFALRCLVLDFGVSPPSLAAALVPVWLWLWSRRCLRPRCLPPGASFFRWGGFADLDDGSGVTVGGFGGVHGDDEVEDVDMASVVKHVDDDGGGGGGDGIQRGDEDPAMCASPSCGVSMSNKYSAGWFQSRLQCGLF